MFLRNVDEFYEPALPRVPEDVNQLPPSVTARVSLLPAVAMASVWLETCRHLSDFRASLVPKPPWASVLSFDAHIRCLLVYYVSGDWRSALGRTFLTSDDIDPTKGLVTTALCRRLLLSHCAVGRRKRVV